jgi:hypothetical protein
MEGSPQFCIWCGHELRPGTRFCTACGRAFDEHDYGTGAEERYSAAPGEDYDNLPASVAPDPASRVTVPDPVTAEQQQQPADPMPYTAAQRSEEPFDHLGLTDRPSGLERPVKESIGGTHRQRWLIATVAVLLVAIGGAVAAVFLLHSSRGKAAAATASISPTSNAQPSRSPSENPTPSPSPAPSQVTVDGVLVDISAVNADASATAVAQTFGTYFGGIDSQNYSQAYNTFTPSLQASIPYQNWSSGLTTTKDRSVVVQSIQHDPNGDINATVSFRSHQAAQYGPVAGDTCDNWLLDYRLVLSGSASPPYLVKKVKPVGAGYQTC